ncbi:MAG TPA: hypothetical protein VMR86_16850 [Myxococcota bacterium]|nr:hypothetical protein [Myxococcota bacterium]
MSTIARVTRELIREIVPKVLFFFAAFLLLFVLFKLFVEQYSIGFAVFTRAAVAALVLGKVVPVLDWVGARYAVGRARRIVAIVVKTLAYALVVIALGTAERVFEASRHDGGMDAGFEQVWANANLSHFLGLVLLLSLVVGAYLTAQEIDRALAPGGLWKLLLERPPKDTRASRVSPDCAR